MKTKLCLHLVLFSLCFSALSLTVFAQKFEISPYAAYNSNNIWGNINSLRSSGMFGVKGGVFVNRNVEVEGNFGVLNHFEFETSATQARGVLWEGSTSYNFFPKEIKYLVPYVTGGIGGISTVNLSGPLTFQSGATTQTWDRNKTFFTFNYGAGLKALRVKGPLGFRADLRLRTLPAYFGSHKTWMEPTVGVNFVWGER